ncbi:hypothetical protein F4776DRAFT_396364 [Hypoxylon sp. NC0597]|nr:hypothetical protein F4776DRAFT_396364 [Hypoxylon sp. NC0597]
MTTLNYVKKVYPSLLIISCQAVLCLPFYLTPMCYAWHICIPIPTSTSMLSPSIILIK